MSSTKTKPFTNAAIGAKIHHEILSVVVLPSLKMLSKRDQARCPCPLKRGILTLQPSTLLLRFPLVRITLEFFSAVVWVGWWHCPCLQGAGRIPSSSSTSVCMSFNAQEPCLEGTPVSTPSARAINCAHTGHLRSPAQPLLRLLCSGLGGMGALLLAPGSW